MQPIAAVRRHDKPAPIGTAQFSTAVSNLWEPACRRWEGNALPCNLQPFLTLNHAAYNAGRNSNVSTVATINPPMIATAIGP
ncbi:hypothetical protein GCM10011247_31070 [Pseudomonas plecoglossicida]|nr:hypothetical protein GCM10011247_31070 [Pseudomonas plecoglossicida]